MGIKLQLPDGMSSVAVGDIIFEADESGVIEVDSLTTETVKTLLKHVKITQLPAEQVAAADGRANLKVDLVSQLTALGIAVDKRSSITYLQRVLDEAKAKAAS